MPGAVPSWIGSPRRALLAAAAACLAAVAVTGYAIREELVGDERPREQPAFVEAERPHAEGAAADFARSCRPPCRVHSVEPVAPGIWRARLNFATGYCVLLRLDEFRRTRAGTHEGWETTSCTAPAAQPSPDRTDRTNAYLRRRLNVL